MHYQVDALEFLICYTQGSIMKARGNLIFYTLFLLVTLLGVGASYYRFMVIHDYMVSYEGDCDPYTQNCFVGCEDDECLEEYYYSQVQKSASDVYRQCGEDITDCDEAYICLVDDNEKCSVTFCDVETEGDNCETLTVNDILESTTTDGESASVTDSETTEGTEEISNTEGEEEIISNSKNYDL